MAFLRFSTRHVHHSVANHLRDQLAGLGWFDASTTPFGAPALRMTTDYIIADTVPATVSAGLMSVTVGPETEPEPQELGGPLTLNPIGVFVDVFMDKDTHAKAVAEDLRDILLGRVDGSRRCIPVIDQTTQQEVDGWLIEFEEIDVTRGEMVSPLRWYSVRFTASVYFHEMTY